MTEEENGKVYVGVNCDSVSHGSCAEVIAIGSAITVGNKDRGHEKDGRRKKI